MATRTERMWEHIRAERALRQLRKEKKEASHEAAVRRKDWTAQLGDDIEAFDDLALPEVERVMPVGDRERRRANLARVASDLIAEHAADAVASPPVATSHEEGVVIEVSQGLCRVALADGTSLLCTVRRALKSNDAGFTNLVAVGDRVEASADGSARGIIQAVWPRRSALARPDPFYRHLRQVVVANADQLLIVASWREPAFWPELVDRYLIAAARNGLEPVICINKTDLADDEAELEAVGAAYRAAGYPVLLTSASKGQGIEEVRRLLQGRTTVLAGLSGVGKSSLLAAVEPGLHLRVGQVSERRHEGRHTTTQVSLHPLAAGGFVVDTPGIREFGLSGLHKEELAGFYPEIVALRGGCRFENCTHSREPGCAVKLAVREGRLSAMRYGSYRKILTDLP